MAFRPLLAGCLLLAVTLLAQDATQSPRRDVAAPQHRAIGIEIRPSKGRPFSGRDRIEITRANRDGTIHTQRIDGPFLARDSSGRIYRQLRSQVGVEYTVVLDPVAHTRTDCDIAKRICEVSAYRVPASVKPPPEGSLDNDAPSAPRESLGADTMEGLEVTGSREIIPTGPDRDDHPQLAELQFWYSPEIGINLSVMRRYTNGGQELIRVVDLSRSEPDPRLFRVLDGFIVQDQRVPPTN